MKKLLSLIAIVTFIVTLVSPIVQQVAEAAFSNWKCSQCGKTYNKAGTNPQAVSGCKVSHDKKHIWFQVK